MFTLGTVSPPLIILLLVPAWTSAQELPLREVEVSSCKFDSTAVQDTVDLTLFLTPPLSVTNSPARREQYTPYINAVASTFEQPAPFSISYWPGGWAEQIENKPSPGDCDAWCSAGPLEGEIQFQLELGRVTKISWWLLPDSPEVMRALEKAVRQADSLHLFPKNGRLAGLPRGTVRLALRLARWPPMAGGVPIGKVRLPLVRQNRPVEIVYQPVPHFPAAAGDYGLSGIVSLQYIVGEDGVVSEESIRVLRAEEPAFIRPAVRAILGSRFRPAQAGGCPVRHLVQQRVVFRR